MLGFSPTSIVQFFCLFQTLAVRVAFNVSNIGSLAVQILSDLDVIDPIILVLGERKATCDILLARTYSRT
jgi:hypothetical protein